MPFNYSKVANDSTDSSEDAIEDQHNNIIRTRPSRFARNCAGFTILRWPIVLFLLSAILICELSILHEQPATMPIGGEINGLVPHFSQEHKIFRADARFASDHKTQESINTTKTNWKSLMPHGSGFIKVEDYTKHTLPPPMYYREHTGDDPIYSIAVFHELHCLMHMSFFIDKLAMKIRNRDFTLNEGELGHNDHCFNYLRNALMCCGDTTLEGQSQAPMFKDVAGTDGTGAVHVCRNYDEIVRWAEEKRFTDSKEPL